MPDKMNSPFPSGSAVAAYLRDSGGDEQDLSVAQQRSVVENWCKENHLQLTQVFSDVAVPGSSTIGRAGFQEMIHHFHADQCPERGVILWKFSRFSRDIDDAQFYRADLRRRGYIVYSLNDNIPDNSNGRVLEALIDWMNARFLEDLSLDVKRGLHHNLREYGTLPGTPPRGFKREQITIGTRRDGSPHLACRWVPDPDWWDKCAEAWQMRAQGVPIKTIHQKLKLFSALNSYPTFFRNRLYTGELRFGDTIIPSYAPALISEETWQSVQELNHQHQQLNNPYDNRGHPRRAASSFLLSGVLYCAQCGSIMNGKSMVTREGYKMEYYYCSRAKRNMDCNARPIPKKIIEDLALQALREFVLDPRVIIQRDKEIALARSGSVDAARKARKRAKSKLGDLEQRISNVLDKIESSPSAPLSLLDRLHQLEEQKNAAQNEYNRLCSIENQETVFARTPQEAEALSTRLTQLLETDDPGKKRLILQSCINRIDVERDGRVVRALITFWNPDNSNLPSGEIMTTGHGSVEAPFYRHKFSITIETQIPHLYSKKA